MRDCTSLLAHHALHRLPAHRAPHGVTSFLRDAAAFTSFGAIIEDALLRKLMQDKSRALISGCATGEDAYTFASLFNENFERSGQGTD